LSASGRSREWRRGWDSDPTGRCRFCTYRFHNATVTVDAKNAVAPCPPLPARPIVKGGWLEPLSPLRVTAVSDPHGGIAFLAPSYSLSSKTSRAYLAHIETTRDQAHAGSQLENVSPSPRIECRGALPAIARSDEELTPQEELASIRKRYVCQKRPTPSWPFDGCGGPQPTVFGVLVGSCVNLVICRPLNPNPAD
jgi:hypothetical protein